MAKELFDRTPTEAARLYRMSKSTQNMETKGTTMKKWIENIFRKMGFVPASEYSELETKYREKRDTVKSLEELSTERGKKISRLRNQIVQIREQQGLDARERLVVLRARADELVGAQA